MTLPQGAAERPMGGYATHDRRARLRQPAHGEGAVPADLSVHAMVSRTAILLHLHACSLV